MTERILSNASDRELLELAAKAAEIPIQPCPCRYAHWPFRHEEEISDKRGHWNPLVDDGDALRLAVKLEMRLSTHCNYKMACASDIHMRTPAQVVPWGGDQESAVRQSIVLLAAAIGATP